MFVWKPIDLSSIVTAAGRCCEFAETHYLAEVACMFEHCTVMHILFNQNYVKNYYYYKKSHKNAHMHTLYTCKVAFISTEGYCLYVSSALV